MKFKKMKLQRDYQDCGVTCLSYIIEYYHGYVPRETLRDETNTSSLGTTAYDLVRTLKKYHFDAYGVKISQNDLKAIPKPAILHFVLANGMNHFVVLLEARDKYVTILDPAKGKVKYTYLELASVFDGIAILSIPYQTIPKLPKETSMISYFCQFLKQNKSILGFIFLFEAIFFFLQMIHHIYFKIVYQRFAFDFISSFKILTTAFLCLLIFQFLFSYGKEKLKLCLEKNLDMEYMNHFLDHILKIPLKKYYSYHEGEILKRIEEAEEIKEIFSNLLITFSFQLFFAILAGIFIFILHRGLFIILFIGLSIYVLINKMTSPLLYKILLRHIENETEWKQSTLESIRLIPSMKHCNTYLYQKDKIKSTLCNVLSTRNHIQEKILRIEQFKSFYLQFLSFIVISLSLYEIYKGELTMVDFLTFQNFYNYLLIPFQSLSELMPKYDYLKGIFHKISEYLAIEEEKLQETSLTDPLLQIKLDHVAYEYPYQIQALQKTTFEIHEKEHIFLSGPSGCGKSTLCKVLTRELTDYQGEVYLNNRNLKDIELNQVRNNILYLSQNEKIFLGSIKDNILFGRKFSDAEFNSVCDICEISSLVDTKKMRYETTIQEDSLSGGEKERVLLARALLTKANIFILDEPLSEVQLDMEQKIIQRVREYLKEKTIIYISHRDVSACFDKEVRLS